MNTRHTRHIAKHAPLDTLVDLAAYGRRDGKQGVRACFVGPRFMLLQFHEAEGTAYLYEEKNIGSHHLAEMKRLVPEDDGLTTYLNVHSTVRLGYTAKLDVSGSDKVKLPARLASQLANRKKA